MIHHQHYELHSKFAIKTDRGNRCRIACFTVFFLSIVLVQPIRAFNWVTNAPMVLPRFGHTATLLPNGKVLVAGGQTNNLNVPGAAELYDLTTGAWRSTGSMTTNRMGATATLLLNGKVLVAGGYDPGAFNFTNQVTAELYDPATEAWTNTRSMTIPRRGHMATLLLNGKVLVAGGFVDSFGGIAPAIVAEIYDPATGMGSLAGSMSTPRYFHTATLQPDGQVLDDSNREYENQVKESARDRGCVREVLQIKA